jgi:hypothetical protein
VKTITHLFGGKTSEEKKAEAQNDAAFQAQQRAAGAAQEDAAVTRAQSAASGRALRTGGRRTLAFMGSELGVSDSLAATGG